MIARYYLAFTKHNMIEFSANPMKARLAFALVPVDLGAFVGIGRLTPSQRRACLWAGFTPANTSC